MKNYIKFLTMEIFKGMEMYNSYNKKISNVIRLNLKELNVICPKLYYI